MTIVTGIDTRDRASLLANGLWPRRNGEAMLLTEMNDHHLINALLKCLAAGDDPETIVEPLAREVNRRGLEADAMTEAARRTS